MKYVLFFSQILFYFYEILFPLIFWIPFYGFFFN